MSKRIDLSGQKFGWLTVLRRAPDIDKRSAWFCQCVCGKETVARASGLRKGSIKSCGCKRALNYYKMKDSGGTYSSRIRHRQAPERIEDLDDLVKW